MKIQNYTKSIKIKSQQLSWGKKKKAEVLGHFSRTYHTSTSVAQWWKHCWIWGLCLLMRKVMPLLTERLSTMGLYITAVSCSSSKQTSLGGFLSSSHRFHLLDQTKTPTHPESAALLLCPTDVIFFLSNNWRKRKSEASIIRLLFFFFFKCLLLAYSCPFFKVTVYALSKWICI